MSTTINTRIQVKRDTTSNWNLAVGMIPLEGEIIIYTDKEVVQKELVIDGVSTTIYQNIPGIKIGDGLAYVQDLPFVDDNLYNELMSHINDKNIHVSTAEKLLWNNKLNIDDNFEVVEGVLILNRN